MNDINPETGLKLWDSLCIGEAEGIIADNEIDEAIEQGIVKLKE